jgi:hypothetical protein
LSFKTPSPSHWHLPPVYQLLLHVLEICHSPGEYSSVSRHQITGASFRPPLLLLENVAVIAVLAARTQFHSFFQRLCRFLAVIFPPLIIILSASFFVSITLTSNAWPPSLFQQSTNQPIQCFLNLQVLLADILPTLVIKSLAPFFVHRFSYLQRVAAVVVLAVLAFLIVATAGSSVVALGGVCFASLASGLGEITFLALSSRYHRSVPLYLFL